MTGLRGKDLVSMRDLSKPDIELVFKRANEMAKALSSGKKLELLKNRIVATLFFEPSTRTRMSFQSAVERLAGNVLDLSSVEATSVKKGESFTDTLRMVDAYSDLIVVRHAADGAARLAAEVCEKPVVNGGDGGNQHPTQTLIDLYAIQKMKGKISGLTISLVGDLKHARTMRSLFYGLGMFGADVNLISPEGLEMNPALVDEVRRSSGVNIAERNKLDLKDADVVYACRVQKERFADPYEAETMQKKFRLTRDTLKGAKDGMIILHPLPKIDEIAPEIDAMPQAKYFEQAALGVPIRMAVIAEIMGV